MGGGRGGSSRGWTSSCRSNPFQQECASTQGPEDWPHGGPFEDLWVHSFNWMRIKISKKRHSLGHVAISLRSPAKPAGACLSSPLPSQTPHCLLRPWKPGQLIPGPPAQQGVGPPGALAQQSPGGWKWQVWPQNPAGRATCPAGGHPGHCGGASSSCQETRLGWLSELTQDLCGTEFP